MGKERLRHIFAVDPGTSLCGWAFIDVPRPGVLVPRDLGTIVLSEGALHKRLGQLMGELTEHVDQARDLWAECVVERPFVNQNHMATLAIAGARAVALALIGAAGLRFFEYSPQVWKMLTGDGRATPEKYTYFVRRLLKRDTLGPDAAAAAGMACYHATTTP